MRVAFDLGNYFRSLVLSLEFGSDYFRELLSFYCNALFVKFAELCIVIKIILWVKSRNVFSSEYFWKMSRFDFNFCASKLDLFTIEDHENSPCWMNLPSMELPSFESNIWIQFFFSFKFSLLWIMIQQNYKNFVNLFYKFNFKFHNYFENFLCASCHDATYKHFQNCWK